MASRTKQKEEARARRLAEEQRRAETEQRQRRLRLISGMVLAVIAVIAVAIAVSSSGGGSTGLQTGTQANQTIASVNTLVAGIPQSGNALGSPKAKVTVTEFGDLQCPICAGFSSGPERQLITNDVRAGKVRLLYRSSETATGNGPDPHVFGPQQAAALAAGEQGKAWQYILLFYAQQGTEGTSYVTDAFLTGIARQISGLNVSQWQTQRQSPSLLAQVAQDNQVAVSRGLNSTPSFLISGPKGEAAPIQGYTDYATLKKQIDAVS